MSGVVFHHIAEGVMARHLKMSVDDAHDEHSVVIPDVKNGDAASANFILGELGVNKRVSQPAKVYGETVTPDVTGMGAKDAVYVLESRGLKVKIQGRGKVKSQSYPAGKEIVKGGECVLTLH
jgi:cell division protein FtsI (penicillin-binding protein 3)